ncbi:MAG: winged helix-turn-helix transcriptional regulator [Sulfolobales archaeon]
MVKTRGSIAIIPLAIIMIIALPIHSLGEIGDEAIYNVYGTITIYLEDGGPTIYMYLNYSSGPGSLLIDLPIEPMGDSMEIIYGNATSAIYMGYLYALILTNSSKGYIVLKYNGIYTTDSEGLRNIEIRNVSWASYIDLVVDHRMKIMGLPPNALETGEGGYIRYRIYSLEGVISIQISLPRNNMGFELIGLLASISTIGVAATYYAILTQRRRLPAKDRIDAVDREILKVLREIEEEASASRIQELTGLPKTTLWRRLRKLERLGYIEIYKVGRRSIIKAKRPP